MTADTLFPIFILQRFDHLFEPLDVRGVLDDLTLMISKLQLMTLIKFVHKRMHSLIEVVLNVLLGRIDDCFSVLLPLAKKAVDGVLKRRCKCFKRLALLISQTCFVRSLQEMPSVR